MKLQLLTRLYHMCLKTKLKNIVCMDRQAAQHCVLNYAGGGGRMLLSQSGDLTGFSLAMSEASWIASGLTMKSMPTLSLVSAPESTVAEQFPCLSHDTLNCFIFRCQASMKEKRLQGCQHLCCPQEISMKGSMHRTASLVTQR